MLGGSRLRSNLPVQLVLPQVHPRTTTTSTTTPSSSTPLSVATSPHDIIADTKRALKAISDTMATGSAAPPALIADAPAVSVTSSQDEALTLTLSRRAVDGSQSGTLTTPRSVPGLVPVHGSGRTAADPASCGDEGGTLGGAGTAVAAEMTSQPSFVTAAGTCGLTGKSAGNAARRESAVFEKVHEVRLPKSKARLGCRSTF